MDLSPTRLKSYAGLNERLLPMVPRLKGGATVIDVGCSTGAFGAELKRRMGVSVIGIERDQRLAEVARTCLDEVLSVDATDGLRQLMERDVGAELIVFSDVLEHLIDPWEAVRLGEECLARAGGGWILASIPNVAHLDTVWNLVRGRWPMRERGIHDSTHLRFFGRRDLSGLLESPRSRIVGVVPTFRIIERPHRLNILARVVGPIWKNGFTYQFKVLVKVTPYAAS